MNKILLLSDDSELNKSFTNYINDYSFFDLLCSNNIENINLNNYEIIIIDYFMNNNDGYDILEKIDTNIKIIILVPSINSMFINLLSNDKVCYVIPRRILFTNLVSKLEMICECNYNNLNSSLVSLFNTLGLSFKLKGSIYIHDILELVINEDVPINMSLYTVLSKKYNKSIKSIEKSIRYAISISFKRTSPDTIDQIFGYIYNYDSGVVGNLEYVECLVNYLKYIKKDYH